MDKMKVGNLLNIINIVTFAAQFVKDSMENHKMM